MIVAPVQGDMKTAVPDVKKAEKKGFKAVEFRYDKIKDPDLETLSKAADDSGHEVVFTIMTTAEGGAFDGTLQKWVDVFNRAAQYNPEYMTVGAPYYTRVMPKLEVPGNCRVIGSYHNFEETPPSGIIEPYDDFSQPPPSLECVYHALRELEPKPDIVKVAVMADDFHDAYRVLGIAHKAANDRQPVIALAMGDEDVSAWERLMSLKLGAAMTFFAIEEGKTTAKGQPTIDKARRAADALGIDISPYLRG
jgi:3-dehydroquinate dehydratase type I